MGMTSISNMGFKVNIMEHEDGGHWVDESQGIDGIVSFLWANLEFSS
jgi:hypothetical protein